MPFYEPPLVEELQSLQHQFQGIKTDAQDLLADLTEAQFNWHPSFHEWSIAQALFDTVSSKEGWCVLWSLRRD
jgi:di/tricarboxylate transporter